MMSSISRNVSTISENRTARRWSRSLSYALPRELPDLWQYDHFQFRVDHGGILRIGLVILSCIGHTVFANERLILNSILQKLVEAWRNRAIPAKAASFALVGVVNTLIDVNVFAIAYALVGIPLIPAKRAGVVYRSVIFVCGECHDDVWSGKWSGLDGQGLR